MARLGAKTTVEYHSREWEHMVEGGWITWTVDGTGAEMLYWPEYARQNLWWFRPVAVEA